MGIILCIISGIFWAFFDISRKFSLKKVKSTELLIFFSLIQIVFFSIWLFLDFFKVDFHSYILPAGLLVFINIISAFLFLESIKSSQLSLTIPLLSFSPLFSAVFSSIILKENLNIFQYFGIISILVGTMILYAKNFTLVEILRSFSIIKSEKGAIYMLIVSILWSVTPVFDKVCFKYATMNFHGFFQSLVMFILLIIIKRKEIDILIVNYLKNYKLISLTLVIGLGATILQFFSISLTYVTIMESIKRSIGQISSVFLGNLYFKETINPQKVIGILFLCVGISSVLYYNF
tara:strand:+ start:40216 stop:41088 length:873 start_codon:yes stop_codon:yes gene_type:complete